MSGIYIPGMEMPKNCWDCPMCYDMMECTAGTPRIGFYKNEMKAEPFDFCTERHPRCPLVPVPEHGRLIDKDVMCEECRRVAEEYDGIYPDCTYCPAHLAPPIIPASEEVEG